MYGNDGLGQTDDQVLGGRDVLLRMINSLDAELARFPEGPVVAQARNELNKAKDTFRWMLDHFYRGDNRRAMNALRTGFSYAHKASKVIQSLDPQSEVARRAQQETARGASFTYQVGQTVAGPVATALEAISPSLAAGVRSNWWIVPAVAGGLLLLFLRR